MDWVGGALASTRMISLYYNICNFFMVKPRLKEDEADHVVRIGSAIYSLADARKFCRHVPYEG